MGGSTSGVWAVPVLTQVARMTSSPYCTTSITDIIPKSSWARMWQW